MELIDFEIGIVDYRNVIKYIKDNFNYDFSDYALTSLKRRIEGVISRYGLKQADVLIDRLREDEKFFQIFLKEISVEATEMFRDPSLWRYLRDELLPVILSDNYKPRVWFPSNVSGDELFSFLIMLKEQDWLDKFDVYASCYSDYSLENIKKGYLKGGKIEVSGENYDRYQGKGKLIEYYRVEGDHAIRDTSLLKNVRFIKQNINFDSSPQDVKLVICRNQLIFFNQGLHDKAIKLFYDNTITGSYIILGAKEQVGLISSKYFRVINESESVYKKISE